MSKDVDIQSRVLSDHRMVLELGNTTAATGKGFAIGSAALTALAALRCPNPASPVRMRKRLGWFELDIRLLFFGKILFDLGEHLAHPWTVVTLHDDGDKVVGDCVGHHPPAHGHAIP